MSHVQIPHWFINCIHVDTVRFRLETLAENGATYWISLEAGRIPKSGIRESQLPHFRIPNDQKDPDTGSWESDLARKVGSKSPNSLPSRSQMTKKIRIPDPESRNRPASSILWWKEIGYRSWHHLSIVRTMNPWWFTIHRTDCSAAGIKQLSCFFRRLHHGCRRWTRCNIFGPRQLKTTACMS